MVSIILAGHIRTDVHARYTPRELLRFFERIVDFVYGWMLSFFLFSPRPLRLLVVLERSMIGSGSAVYFFSFLGDLSVSCSFLLSDFVAVILCDTQCFSSFFLFFFFFRARRSVYFVSMFVVYAGLYK